MQIFTMVGVVVLTSLGLTSEPWPKGRNPELLVCEVISAYKAKDVSSVLEKRTTKTGKRVLGWLIEQKWFDERPEMVVTERKVSGDRYELVGVYKFSNGVEKVSLVFFWEGGALRFHDVFCFDMKRTFRRWSRQCPGIFQRAVQPATPARRSADPGAGSE